MSTETQQQQEQQEQAQEVEQVKPFGQVLAESVRGVQASITALQTADGQEGAAAEQVAAAEAALTGAENDRALAIEAKASAKSSARLSLTALSEAVIGYRDSL